MELHGIEDVVAFLLANPQEVHKVRCRMADVELERTRPAREAAEAARRAALPLKPCNGGGYGCGRSTPGGYMCESCKEDVRNDPDAYK